MKKPVTLIPTLLLSGWILFSTGQIRAATYTLTDNWKTPDAILRRMIGPDPGDSTRTNWLQQAKRRLDNTGVFFPVHISNRSALNFSVRDKWTAVPVLGFRRGGEVQVTRLGAADDNFLGTMATINIYADFLKGYGSNEGRESVSLSFSVRWVRFLGWNLMLDLQRFDTVSPATLYDRSGRIVGAHLYEREEICIGIGREFFPDFYLMLQGAFVADTTADRTQLSLTEYSGDRDSRKEWSLRLLLDQTLQREYLSRGARLEASAGAASDGALRLLADFRYYHLDRHNHNLALRFSAGWTGADSYGQQFIAGGTASMRGFFHDAFVSSRHLMGSVEYRLNLGTARLFNRDFLFWQLNLFADCGLFGNTVPAEVAGYAGSVGLGLRVATIPISNNLLRIDLAWGYYPYSRFDLVVATRHYF